jgi:hypothetical protein
MLSNELTVGAVDLNVVLVEVNTVAVVVVVVVTVVVAGVLVVVVDVVLIVTAGDDSATTRALLTNLKLLKIDSRGDSSAMEAGVVETGTTSSVVVVSDVVEVVTAVVVMVVDVVVVMTGVSLSAMIQVTSAGAADSVVQSLALSMAKIFSVVVVQAPAFSFMMRSSPVFPSPTLSRAKKSSTFCRSYMNKKKIKITNLCRVC